MRREPQTSAMNQLNVSLQHSIVTLSAQGWSARKVARELGLKRETVGRYLRLAADAANQPFRPSGPRIPRIQNQPFRPPVPKRWSVQNQPFCPSKRGQETGSETGSVLDIDI